MGIANMTPVLVKNWFKFLEVPINERWLGSHKTYRGFITGIIAGGIVGLYLDPWYLGFVLGFGALWGDSFKSFWKRRFKIAPGKPWIPFDQIDWTIGGLLFASFFISISWEVWVIIILGGIALHFLTNFIGYKLKIKTNKW